MNFIYYYRGLPKAVYIIFFAQIINRFGDFVLPFLTLYLVEKMGFTYQQAGFAAMLASLSAIPGGFAGGKTADHIGRKRTYAIFQTAAGISIFFCTFFENAWLIVGFICLSSFLNGGVRPIFSAIIADVLPPEKRQQGYSLSYLGINIGVALGPIVAGFLFNHYLPLIFIGDALTSFLAVALMMLNISESMPDAETAINENRNESPETGSLLSVLFKRPPILFYMIINIFLSAVYNQQVFGLPIVLNEVFGNDGARNYGFLMSLNAVTVLVLTMLISHATHRWHPLSSITLTGLLYAVGFGMIGLISDLPLFMLSTLVWTVGEILIVTNSGVFVASYTPQNYRARFNAAMSLSWCAGSVIGTSGMGVLMNMIGIRNVWAVVFFFGLAGAAGMHLLKLRLRFEKNAADGSDEDPSGSDII